MLAGVVGQRPRPVMVKASRRPAAARSRAAAGSPVVVSEPLLQSGRTVGRRPARPRRRRRALQCAPALAKGDDRKGRSTSVRSGLRRRRTHRLPDARSCRRAIAPGTARRCPLPAASAGSPASLPARCPPRWRPAAMLPQSAAPRSVRAGERAGASRLVAPVRRHRGRVHANAPSAQRTNRSACRSVLR